MKINLIVLGLIGIGIKLLLIPAYFSTDFDVHHNWLRITHQKPLSQWYYDNVSKWTLDYPPFFAYFQYILAIIASSIDISIVSLQLSQKVIYFQRLSVIFCDITFLYVLALIFNKKLCFQLVFSYLFVPFIILDNIHFQYNIMLQTIFLLSLYFLIIKKQYLKAAFTYSVLINFKHIYIYCALAYFVIILKDYVLQYDRSKLNKVKQNNNYEQVQQKQGIQLIDQNSKNQWFNKLARLAIVGLVTIIPFILSFAPFIYVGGLDYIQQIISRLFPFGRGLIHDYWAPNFWAIYYFTDKILLFFLYKLFGYTPFNSLNIKAHSTSLNYLKVLPEPSSNMTIIIILLGLIPILIKYFKKGSNKILDLIVLNGLIFFAFGYHVHEKAITPYIHLLYVFIMSKKVKQSLNSQQNKQDQTYQKNINSKKQNTISSLCFSQLQIYGLVFINIVNLYPLLIDNQQKTLKIISIIMIYFIVSNFKSWNIKSNLYSRYIIYIAMIIVFLTEILFCLFKFIYKSKLEFLPLMFNSTICALVNIVWTFKIYLQFIKN